MTTSNMDLSELLAKHDQGDFMRTLAEQVLQLIMEADVEGLIGAGRHERSADRATWRNGYRERALDTRVGTLNLKVPKRRQGSCFPGFLEPRKTSGKALVAVVQEAWISGVSTRKVDDLVQAMGLTGLSKSTVSKLCKDMDERVNEFLNRPQPGEWPCLWLDATDLKARQDGRIVSVAAIIAVAANTDGRREVIGLGLGPSEAEPFCVDFLRGLHASWAGKHQARDLRRPRRSQECPRARLRGLMAAMPCSLDAQRSSARLARPAHRRGRRDPPSFRSARPDVCR